VLPALGTIRWGRLCGSGCSCTVGWVSTGAYIAHAR
jgi:hypothetical protein